MLLIINLGCKAIKWLLKPLVNKLMGSQGWQHNNQRGSFAIRHLTRVRRSVVLTFKVIYHPKVREEFLWCNRGSQLVNENHRG